MQLRSANSSTSASTQPRNPIIIAFDRKWNELFRTNLSKIDCMAYGTREDYENGYRGIKHNWCTADTSVKVYAWSTPNL